MIVDTCFSCFGSAPSWSLRLIIFWMYASAIIRINHHLLCSTIRCFNSTYQMMKSTTNNTLQHSLSKPLIFWEGHRLTKPTNYIPQIPLAEATLLFDLAVSSYKILANESEYLPSWKSSSAKAFSYASKNPLFCGSETRFSRIIAAFLQTSGTGCGVFITFNNLSIALKTIYHRNKTMSHYSVI